jgi:hypothetical protein
MNNNKIDSYKLNNKIVWLQELLTERFGNEWKINKNEIGYSLFLKNSSGSINFTKEYKCFSEIGLEVPYSEWNVKESELINVNSKKIPAPGAKTLNSPLIEYVEGKTLVHYDIFGLTYWMLTRMEEIDAKNFDIHNRFSAKFSHAYKYKYLERPVVDEWMEILSKLILLQWPNIILKDKKFTIQISHDVDNPSFSAFESWENIFKSIFGDIIKRSIFKYIIIKILIKINTLKELKKYDPYNTFKWLMDQAEANKLITTFNFIVKKTSIKHDGNYNINHPAIKNLLLYINKRGHNIGLHGSYGSFLSFELLNKEFVELKNIAKQLKLNQIEWSSRMHFLRWKTPITMNILNQIGIDCDTTLGYADHIGFRCGTCFQYNAFDHINGEKLNLKINPLLVMDTTLISDAYMAKSNEEEIKKRISLIIYECMKVQGCFTLLWHNCQLIDNKDKEIFKWIIDVNNHINYNKI